MILHGALRYMCGQKYRKVSYDGTTWKNKKYSSIAVAVSQSTENTRTYMHAEIDECSFLGSSP